MITRKDIIDNTIIKIMDEYIKRRKDNIYVCNKCNKQYPINKENK